MYPNFINHIKKYIELDPQSIDILYKYTKTISLKKKEFLLKEGQICNSIFFIEGGCLRMYFINEKLAEQITQFALENWWISDFHSFIGKNPSDYYIQAVENSEIVFFDTLSFDALLKELPLMESYLRIIMIKALAASQLRIKYLYELSKEDFYNHFCTSFPEFVQRVPQYMIASYLGLTPEYVSELRKKKQ